MTTGSLVDIRNSYGAIFIGLLFNLMLFGLELAQTWIYYRQYWHRDNKSFKLLVAFLIIMDAMSSLMCVLAIYWHLVLNFGKLESLGYSVWFTNAVPIFSAIPMCAVQFYYVRRAYITSESLFCPIVVVPLAFFSIISGFYFTIKVLAVGQSESHVPTWFTCYGLSINVLSDIVITATICLALYRKRTGFARTDSIITTLIMNTINSGFLLTVFGTAILILYAIAPTNLVWLALYWVESKCYLNSFLAMLNCRDYVRNHLSTTDVYSLSSIRLEPPNKSQSRQPAVAVTVHRSTASDFARSKSDHTTGPALEDSKP